MRLALLLATFPLLLAAASAPVGSRAEPIDVELKRARQEARVAGNLSLAFPGGVTAQQIMEGAPDICISTGSACSSAEVEPSHVLRALGLPEARARATLRIGIGRFTSPAEVDLAAAALGAAWRRAVAGTNAPAGKAGVAD